MLWEQCSIPLLLELGFHGGLWITMREKKTKKVASWVTPSLWHGHIPLSPPEPIFTFTTNNSETNISIHSFCHFLLLSTKAYETSQKTTHLFHFIYSFVLILQRIKNPKELTYSTISPTPAKSDVQKNPKHILKTTEVSEKLESVLQRGNLTQYNTPFFFKLVNCGEQTTVIWAGILNN